MSWDIPFELILGDARRHSSQITALLCRYVLLLGKLPSALSNED